MLLFFLLFIKFQFFSHNHTDKVSIFQLLRDRITISRRKLSNILNRFHSFHPVAGYKKDNYV